ncbi:multicopper oxidase family protein [Iamia sp. SCSIO 61187]|uniref:multicopper oxidase family protein n=1 Tax=Iamia sp. SCSIO 61187 TaxID=2722752 RepID=UPI001C639954|nr:multicopper oxidase family protein [Iamia sp. SCSIO 61187]QYG94284.1 multicopper oxidase family protein [Iamia sp. SCSIO 61187]
MSGPFITRRRFLVLAGGTAGAAAGGGLLLASRDDPPSIVTAGSPRVAAVEQRRRRQGAAITDVAFAAAPLTASTAAGRQTWAYGDTVPGREIRMRAGSVLRAAFTNDLPEPTTVHWHGIALRNDMDGVPGVTQPPVAPGERFDYEFTAPDPGTYFFHPHVGPQLDRGLYAPLIVEDPNEPGDYDRELVLVLDDWLAGADPDTVLAELRDSGMGGMDMGSDDTGMDMGDGGMDMGPSGLGMDVGDVDYPTYVINGRPPEDPFTFEASRGERIRLRIINAGSDRPFRFAVGGHRLTVTHSDGFSIEPVTGDAVLLGMGERYDAVITLAVDGAIPVVALPEGGTSGGLAVIRTATGTAPTPDVRPAELEGRLLTLADLRATEGVTLPPRTPDRTLDFRLAGDMDSYRWTLNGRPFHESQLRNADHQLREGDRVRLRFENRSPMFHPMHLHGHTFQVQHQDGPGARKDTAIVRPMETVTADFEADNPGQWALHCHNIYHAEAGMMTVLSYVR